MDPKMSLDVQFFLRWIHFLAGIAWIGHLYFFNFVNANFAKTMDGPTKQKVVPELMPRALFWFRWGAMFTFLSGIGMAFFKYFLGENAPGFAGNEQSLMGSARGQWISMGALFGTIMWFNVWFIIWPRQKSIMRWVKRGESPAEMANMVKVAANASKLNTYLSAPMLFGMAAGSGFFAHRDVVNVTTGKSTLDWSWVIAAIVIGFAVVHLLYTIAAKVPGIPAEEKKDSQVPVHK